MSDHIAAEKGLPASIDTERFVLGSVLLDDTHWPAVAAALEADDFSVDRHRRIFARMAEMQEHGERIDRITLSHALINHHQLEACGGLTYLLSLDEGLPRIAHLDSYLRIVKGKSLMRKGAYASQALLGRFLLDNEDAQVIFASAAETMIKLGDSDVKSGLLSAGEIIGQFEGGINAFLNPSKRVHGISTGFAKLDEMTGGFLPGELIILAARPSMGKTAMALNIAQHAAVKNGVPTAIFSLEMSREMLLTRMLCATARVDSQKFRAGYLNSDERHRLMAAASQLVAAPIYIDDSSGATLMDVHAKTMRFASERKQKLGLVVIDYLQLMSGGRKKAENRNQEISGISRGLKLLSKDLAAPILALSQLSRATETRPGDHRPQMSDLRESGSLEQDADVVAFIYREEVYKRDREDLRGLAELLLSKQRNGPVGKIDLVFLHHLTKFESRAEDFVDDEPPMWRAVDAGGGLPYADN